MKSQIEKVPIDLEILLSPSYFLWHTVWILMTESFLKEQKSTQYCIFLCKITVVGVSFPMALMIIQDENAFFHSLINLLPTFQSDLYADSRLHGVQKVYFSLLTHTTQILLKLQKTLKRMWIVVHLGRIRNEKIKNF